MLNYIKGLTTKGCIFFDTEKYTCKIHNYRPLSCFLYGITPDEEFKPRFEKIKKEYKGVLGAIVKEQCNLIKTKDDKPVTMDDTNKWFEELNEIEKIFGIERHKISDGPGGSYRTFHDHILLFMVPDSIMKELQDLRMTGEPGKSIIAVHEFISIMKNTKNNGKKENKNT